MRAAAASLLSLLLLATVAAGTAAAVPLTGAELDARLHWLEAEVEAARKEASYDRALAAARLKSASAELLLVGAVQSGADLLQLDLSGLEAGLRQAAAEPDQAVIARLLAHIRHHREGLQQAAMTQPVASASARQTLELALREAELKATWYERLEAWLTRVLGLDRGGSSGDWVEGATPYLIWAALLVGAGGISLLAYSLVRNLSGHGAGGETVRTPDRRERADRPLTPEELRRAARSLAAKGEVKEALRTAYQALLMHMDRLRLIHLTASLTMREQQRLVSRRHPVLAPGLGQLHDLLEVRLYAGHGVSAEDFTACEQMVDQLWREGDALSNGGEATSGGSSSAPSR